MDNRPPPFGGVMNFSNHLPYSNPAPPQFTDPWHTTSAPSANSSIYAPTSINPTLGLEGIARQQGARLNNNVSTGQYRMTPVTAASAGNLFTDFSGAQQDLLTSQQDMMSPSRSLPAGYGSDAGYTSAPSPVHATYASAPSPYDGTGYAPAPVSTVRPMYEIQHQDHSRRLSQPSVSSNSFFDLPADAPRSHRQNSLIDFYDRGLQNNNNTGFQRDATLDGARDMVAMSQNTTPRNIYGVSPRLGRGSGDAYGFPATHPPNSTISSSSGYQYYGSVDGSVSEYSNGSDIESVSARTLPPPGSILGGGVPPAPQSMMGQFSSKVSSSTLKKHKCKICEKRFTRPSSLQTHMYSHTGEKPFPCDIEGCGRHFSVVSNLRRHKKVHKGDGRSETGSEDHHQSDE
ncbi:hypothetical protein SBOR_0041 [Sclerotinia borealis F-4128]|uniref:C2H2-type domain-containing protein n=1 Tax=Sclerotinia borealis (strain F-4128) TaxID=1432307 RepID=W9CTU6_SCLBF|nr:hypothetical protein SBOR_0041 [Sclerotinia borealis F-4128]